MIVTTARGDFMQLVEEMESASLVGPWRLCWCDDLLRPLKEKAAREGRTLRSVANELLRQGLSPPRSTASWTLELEGWKAKQPPSVDLFGRDKLFDLISD